MRPFFESLKAGGFDKQIRSVSVDMNAAYPRLIKEFLPHAKLTYDRFHVMQMLNKNVLYEARPTSIQRAREKYRSLSAAQRKSDEAIAEKSFRYGRSKMPSGSSLPTPRCWDRKGRSV